MYLKFEEVLGAQVANTVMEHLAPVGWADVATRRDLDAVQVLMRKDLDAVQMLVTRDLDAQTSLVRSDLVALGHELRTEIRGDINRLMLWLFPTILTSLALAFGAAKGA